MNIVFFCSGSLYCDRCCDFFSFTLHVVSTACQVCGAPLNHQPHRDQDVIVYLLHGAVVGRLQHFACSQKSCRAVHVRFFSIARSTSIHCIA